MPEPRARPRAQSFLLLALLLVLAALLEAGYLRRFAAQEPLADAPYGDSLVFLDEAARHFAAGGEDGAFYKPPGYTFLLWVVGADSATGRRTVRLLQAALGLAILALVFLMARRRGGNLAGTVAFLALLCYAPATFHQSKLLDSIPALFLLVLACAGLDRLLHEGTGPVAALVVGVLFGLAGLFRPANLLLAPFAALLLTTSSKGSAPGGASDRRDAGTTPAPAPEPRRRPLFGLLLLAGAGLPVVPVTLHNLSASGDFIPVNYSEGHTFLVGNNPNCAGIYNLPAGYPDGVLNERQVEFEMARHALGRNPTPAEQRDESYRRGLAYLRSGTLARLADLWRNKLRFAITSHEVDDNYSLARERDRLGLLRPFVMPFTLLLLLGIPGLLLPAARPRGALLAPVAVTFLLLLAFYVTGRYRLPAAPFLAVGCGVLVATLADRGRRALVTRAGLLAACLPSGFLLLFLEVTPLPVPEVDLVRSERLFDIVLDTHAARSLAAAGEAPRAGAVLARSLADHPGLRALEDAFVALLDRRSPEEVAAIAAAARTAAPRDPRVEALLRLAGAPPDHE